MKNKNLNGLFIFLHVLSIVFIIIISYFLFGLYKDKKLVLNKYSKLSSEVNGLKKSIKDMQKINNDLDVESSDTNISTNENTELGITNFVGTWKVSKIIDSNGNEEFDYMSLFGSGGFADGLIFKEDKTFSDEIGKTISSEDTTNGNFEVNGSNITLKFSNGALRTLKYNSQTELLEFPNYIGDHTLILKKQ
ncbi:MAG: lipocalin family protein [Bacilli bacterium]|nr:lipocalin family protein [Bacilli bacterium]